MYSYPTVFMLALFVGSVFLWVERYSRGGILKRYVTWVGNRLVATHGPADYYTKNQVMRALVASRVSPKHAPYAFALYCSEDEFRSAPDCAELSYLELRRTMLDLQLRYGARRR